MTYQEQVVRESRSDAQAGGPVEVVSRKTTISPSGGELARRWVILIFGIIQVLIALRIGLLLLDAREGNVLVRAILDGSQLFVLPFIGIFNSNALTSGGSILDIAAIAALIGWSVLEWVVIWAVALFRRETVVS